MKKVSSIYVRDANSSDFGGASPILTPEIRSPIWPQKCSDFGRFSGEKKIKIGLRILEIRPPKFSLDLQKAW